MKDEPIRRRTDGEMNPSDFWFNGFLITAPNKQRTCRRQRSTENSSESFFMCPVARQKCPIFQTPSALNKKHGRWTRQNLDTSFFPLRRLLQTKPGLVLFILLQRFSANGNGNPWPTVRRAKAARRGRPPRRFAIFQAHCRTAATSWSARALRRFQMPASYLPNQRADRHN